MNLKIVEHCPAALNHKMIFVNAGLGTNESLIALRNVHQLNKFCTKKKIPITGPPRVTECQDQLSLTAHISDQKIFLPQHILVVAAARYITQ